MLNRDHEQLNQASRTVARIALELARAQPGQDDGLLPVNSLLLDLQAAAAQLPPVIAAAIDHARALVDATLETTGTFDEVTLRRLDAWTHWLTGAVRAARDGRPIPPHAGTTTNPDDAVVASDADGVVLDLDRDRGLLVEFCAEAREHLQLIEQGVMVLEHQPDDRGTLNTIFRAFHTFKGGAGLLNLLPLKELAHELETVLDLARARKQVVNQAIIDLILAGGDTCRRFIDEIDAQLTGNHPGTPIRLPIRDLLSRARALTLPGQPATPAPTRAVTPVYTSRVAPPETGVTTPPTVPPGTAHLAGGSSSARDSVVKVDARKLEALVDLVGEMVITHSQLRPDEPASANESPRRTQLLTQSRRLTRELQRTALSLRLVPLRATFQKLTRLVRDVAGQQGKQAALLLRGEDTELDRTLVEQLADPLMHMIRNSVDHGLERPEERVQAGKPATGTVELSAFHRGGNIVIQIRDDGRGLDPAKLQSRAIDLGILTGRNQLTDQEAFGLIFAAGFSTAETVTDISGRGVGMDVVRRNLERLRGRIDVTSTPGRGTTFTLSLPLTLAIIDGLIVTLGEQRFILPTLSVRESFRPTQDRITRVGTRGELVKVRDCWRPLLRLHEFFGIRPGTTEPTEALCIVVESHGETRCVMVDQVLDRQELVIKSLGEACQPAPGIAGATILGDGRVGLIIDIDTLGGGGGHPAPAVAA